MLSDLAALAPPLLICVAFLIAVAVFLKHEMGPKDDGDDKAGVDRPGRDRNVG